LLDRLIGLADVDERSPSKLDEIEAYISKHLTADELEKLAEKAKRKKHLFPGGRPEENWYLFLVRDVESHKEKGVRAACEWLAKNVERYRGRQPGALRERYYKLKRASARP
jgi:hypothetical protein